MEKNTLHMTCIRCSMGCPLTVEVENAAVVSVSGNGCHRGVEYAMTEAIHPIRTVTSTVRTKNGVRSVVAVKTVPDVPKARIFEVMAAIRSLTVEAPVRIGDVLLKNVAGTGCDLVATANLNRK